MPQYYWQNMLANDWIQVTIGDRPSWNPIPLKKCNYFSEYPSCPKWRQSSMKKIYSFFVFQLCASYLMSSWEY